MELDSWYGYFACEAMERNAEYFVQWLVMVLYGITATLWAYCVSLFMPSPLASFAVAAGYQVIMFLVCDMRVGSWPTLMCSRTGLLDRILGHIHLRSILCSGYHRQPNP